MTGRHHAGNGLCFTRLLDGTVCVEQFEDERCEGSPVKAHHIQPLAWAAVVAAVSRRGLTDELQIAAYQWHQRDYELVIMREDEVTVQDIKRPGWRHE
ncbi:MAG TPA: hypothetical protein VGK73_25225 [Polyangiaceae bacterium]